MLLNHKPNIFQLATKELTQDSFFAWLLQWADGTYADLNPNLNQTAQNFVRLLIGQNSNYNIVKVDAGRQLQNIDIWAEINNEYFLCIEDKTNTGEHSDQLQRYNKLVKELYKGKEHILKFIYLKTGNESSATLNNIHEEYLVIGRKVVLALLNEREVENEIFNDFKSYLRSIEELTASCDLWETVNTNLSAAEGFYIKLQQLIPEWTDWKYVSNPRGGFLGFWFHWVRSKNFELYIQIENIIGKNIQVNIKIANWEPKIDTLNHTLSELQLGAVKYGLEVVKPSKYRLGKASTLATVKNILPITNEGNIDIDQLLINLQNLQSLLDEYIHNIMTEF
jgi:hypothetical protein